ncbi:SURF1 family protein [Nocardioides mangrovicus]|uniref:SURF1-like protein n=1 Tax=Nocardioides mangrovicus TaxID=2478913 RepID=A0A3L8NZI4_9ACTN|nr:SURF1 family protein [Nocardioides mangrovicus]RLV48077.1 SURF1 family protein [Nocardioides mangrovicus]
MIKLLAWRFWGGHVAVVLAVIAAGGLGLWQLHAWREHRAEAARDLTDARPVALASVMGGDSAFPGKSIGQPVRLSGSWLSSGTVYVKGREHGGRSGYWVVSPLLVDGTRSAMPVVRGWSTRPQAPSVSGAAAVTGWLQPGDGDGLVDEDRHDDVVPELAIPDLVNRVDTDLYSGYVIARDEPAAARTTLAAVGPQSTPGVSWSTGLRNLFYAVEWWVFGGFAVAVWVRWLRDELNPPVPEELREEAVAER